MAPEMTIISTRHPRPSFQHRGDLFTPEGQKAGNKRQTQKTEDNGRVEKEGEQGRGRKGYLLWGDKSLSLNSGEIDVAPTMVVYEGKKDTVCWEEMLSFDWTS